jgi:hypothetical protein
VIVFAVGGLRLDLEWLLAAMGGPGTLVVAYSVHLGSWWLAPLSMAAFIAFQRISFAWLWCVIWTGIGLGFVFWATHIISIT